MVTLKSLAKELNVSVSTVSKALNNNPEISQRTIDRVNELAKFYNYHPNKTALNLRKSETKTIGVIIPSTLNRFFAKVLFGIEKEATNHTYNIITCISNELLQKEIDSINLLANGSVDGFIVALSEETQLQANFHHLNNLKNKGIPLVLFDRTSKAIDCDKVIIDDFEATKQATLKLLNAGKEHIAFVSTIDDLSVGKLRLKGFKQAFIDTSKHLNENLILSQKSNSNTQAQLTSLFNNNPKLDGVIAADNTSGTMSISLAQKNGLKIPEDLSVIGFADEEISNLTFPKLAIVDQNAELIGKTAFKLMLNRLDKTSNNYPSITEVVSTQFKKMESFK